MDARRLGADEQLSADLLVAATEGDQGEDLLLTRCQGGACPAGTFRGTGPQRVQLAEERLDAEPSRGRRRLLDELGRFRVSRRTQDRSQPGS